MNKVYRAQNLQMQALINEGNELVKKNVGLSRYEHSLRVAETAVLLCNTYSVNSDKGYYAGLMHDLCKEMDATKLLDMARQDGSPIVALEKEKPSLLHGRAGAIYLQNNLSVSDSDILEAVRHHTFGYVGMCNLAKIVYVADKIEPGRPYNTKKYYDFVESSTLNKLVACVAEDNIEVLEKKGKMVSLFSQAFLLSISEKE